LIFILSGVLAVARVNDFLENSSLAWQITMGRSKVFSRKFDGIFKRMFGFDPKMIRMYWNQ
jgi:hypothetical protein